MNKLQLVKKLAFETQGKEKEISLILEKLMDIVSETLYKGDAVRLVGFGTFKTRERKARIGFLPKTKEEVLIPGGRITLFVPSKKLKEALLERKGVSVSKLKLSLKSAATSKAKKKKS